MSKKKVGILYQPRLPETEGLAQKLAKTLEAQGTSVWLSSAWEEGARSFMPGTDLLVGIGGDGTILRIAQIVVPLDIPIVGVNFGKLGFMAELSPDEALDKVPSLLNGPLLFEERAMLQATILTSSAEHPIGATGGDPHTTFFYALNDVVAGRGAPGRPVYIEVIINGHHFTTYRADGVIAATATGSTAYSLSAGGPILYPESRDFLLTPVAPHTNLSNSLVLPPTAVVLLKTHSDHEAILSIDGQLNIPLKNGDTVEVRASPYSVRFLKGEPHANFHNTLLERLR